MESKLISLKVNNCIPPVPLILFLEHSSPTPQSAKTQGYSWVSIASALYWLLKYGLAVSDHHSQRLIGRTHPVSPPWAHLSGDASPCLAAVPHEEISRAITLCRGKGTNLIIFYYK